MAEKEYIERECAYKACEKYFNGVCGYDVSESEVINDFEKIIDSVPAADVEPVRHGRWKVWDYAPKRKAIILDSAYEQYEALGYPHRIILAFQCSECNMVSMVDKSRGKYDFCPNCGAKMDGKECENNA